MIEHVWISCDKLLQRIEVIIGSCTGKRLDRATLRSVVTQPLKQIDTSSSSSSLHSSSRPGTDISIHLKYTVQVVVHGSVNGLGHQERAHEVSDMWESSQLDRDRQPSAR